MYRNTPITSYPISEPYFRASAHVASSPSLDGVDPPPATVRWVEAASARVIVLDAQGKQLRVTVEIMNRFGQDKSSAVTDEHGQVVFHGLKNGKKYFVHLSNSPQMDVKMIDLGKFLVHPSSVPLSR